jgi:hypothetical protein
MEAESDSPTIENTPSPSIEHIHGPNNVELNATRPAQDVPGSPPTQSPPPNLQIVTQGRISVTFLSDDRIENFSAFQGYIPGQPHSFTLHPIRGGWHIAFDFTPESPKSSMGSKRSAEAAEFNDNNDKEEQGSSLQSVIKRPRTSKTPKGIH